MKYYKYGLPIPNIDPDFKSIEDFEREEKAKKLTTNEKTWTLLGLNEESPYELYEFQIKKEFNYEVDMYGDESDNN